MITLTVGGFAQSLPKARDDARGVSSHGFESLPKTTAFAGFIAGAEERIWEGEL
jgi:hypothetical protein